MTTSMSSTLLAVAGSFAIGALGMWAIDERPVSVAGPDPVNSASPKGATGSAVTHAVNAGAVKVELFAMSQCPYGVEAEKLFGGIVEKFGADVDYKVEYIGDITPTGELTAMHGPKEVKGNTYQVCAHKYSEKWVEFIACQNENWKAVDANGEACAERVGLDPAVLKSCTEGPEGKELLEASYRRAKERDASGSPTIYIGGKEYQGSRRPGDVMRAVCAAYAGEKAAACSDIPVPPKVDVIVLTDRRCGEDCNPAQLQGVISQRIANPSVKVLDYGDAEGKKLFDLIKPTSLPAVVFDGSLDADKEASQELGKGLRKAGEYRLAEVGEWLALCADKDGCALPECKSTMQCKPEEPNKLEVFVMSECPYGVKALDAMKEVIENFDKAAGAGGSKLVFQVQFIGEGDASSLSSMHGQSEVDEDIREACAAEHFAKDRKFMNYIWCRNKNIRSPNWEACATSETGVDAAVMKECFDGDEGKKLLAKSFAQANSLKFGASPTWLVNGKYQFSGIDAETIKTNICAHNKLPGCENKLAGDAPSPQGGAPAPGCGE